MGVEDLLRLSMMQVALYMGAPILGICGLMFSESMIAFLLRMVKHARITK